MDCRRQVSTLISVLVMTLPLSGIYKITNLTNGRVYIGQSKNVYLRRKQHFVALRNGNHENKLMQQDWNTNNRGFRWDIVELCPISELNNREKYWIDYFNSIEQGYNAGWVPYKRKVKKSPQRKQKHYHKTR